MDVAEWSAEDANWQLAISLIAAWRAAGGERARGAVVRRLAGAAAEGHGATAEQALFGLTTLSNMFIELYADCVGSSVDNVLQEAAALRWGNTPRQLAQPGYDCAGGPCHGLVQSEAPAARPYPAW